MLRGLMMDYPLVLTHFLERARTFFPTGQIVSRLPDGSVHRYEYAEWYKRVCRLAHALVALGVQPGDRVATLCWNHYRHFELYFAVPAIGAVLHTLNVRLYPSELGYVARHAGDRVIFVDRSLLGLLEGFRREVTSLEHVVVIPDEAATPAGMLDYEAVVEPHPEHFAFPALDENSAAVMCYTSGTTGNPKGVLYSHRSTVLHTLTLGLSDTKAVSERDCILPIVPMFHANAWGLPFAAAAMGSKIVFPGPDLKPQSLLDLMAAERVTLAAAVPAIWLGVLALLDEHPGRWDLSSMRLVSIGGSAAPPALIDGLRCRHGLGVMHTWGMTETNPLATVARIKRNLGGLDDAAQLTVLAKQGYAIPFVEQRHVDEQGHVLPWDGVTMGELEVRGPWVAASYYENQEAADRFTADGWFKTGDVVTIDAEGYVQISDRSKDVIKSGGEWISTQALENALMSHPAVLEAAVFAARHAKWDERPLAAVVLKSGKLVEKAELIAHLRGRFPKWWLPEDCLFLDQIPRTSTGKFKKRELRERFGDYLLRRERATKE